VTSIRHRRQQAKIVTDGVSPAQSAVRTIADCQLTALYRKRRPWQRG